MNDFLRKTIKIGDKVAFIPKNYSSLERGIVIALTPCYARVKAEKPRWYNGGEAGILRDSEQIVFIPTEQ